MVFFSLKKIMKLKFKFKYGEISSFFQILEKIYILKSKWWRMGRCKGKNRFEEAMGGKKREKSCQI